MIYKSNDQALNWKWVKSSSIWKIGSLESFDEIIYLYSFPLKKGSEKKM